MSLYNVHAHDHINEANLIYCLYWVSASFYFMCLSCQHVNIIAFGWKWTQKSNVIFPSHWGISHPCTLLIFDVRWIQNRPIHYCCYCQANTSQKTSLRTGILHCQEESHLDLATFSFAIQSGNYICRYSEGKIHCGGLIIVYGSTNKVGLTINQIKWKLSRLSHVCCADQWIDYLKVGNTVSCKLSIAVKTFAGFENLLIIRFARMHIAQITDVLIS